jgi:hypothetical protein
MLSLALIADEPKISYEAGDAALEICGVSASDPMKLIEKILALPNSSLVEKTDEYLTLSEDRKMRLWTLAINDHPASPAIICRTFKSNKDGSTDLQMDVSCFAKKVACDKLTVDFAAHNRKIIEQASE